MKIRMRDGRVFLGTPRQIVQAMQDIAFGVDALTTREYIEWVATSALEFEGVQISLAGETDDELAASLVREMVRAGLAIG